VFTGLPIGADRLLDGVDRFNDAFGQRQFAQDWPSATALGRLNEIVTAGNCA
jgi:hypothetical protein